MYFLLGYSSSLFPKVFFVKVWIFVVTLFIYIVHHTCPEGESMQDPPFGEEGRRCLPCDEPYCDRFDETSYWIAFVNYDSWA